MARHPGCPWAGRALASHLDGKCIQVVQHDVVGLREQSRVTLQRRGTV